MVKKSSYIKIFEFLKEKEIQKISFTINEIANFCEIKNNTILKYFSEKLYNYVIKEEINGKNFYYAKNLINIDFEKFELIISQGNPNYKFTEIEIYYKKLLDKSFDAFLVAIENYNKPLLKNKVEIFTILIINAWELLLKAKLIKDHNDKKVIYIEKKDKLEFTISVEESVKKIYKDNDVIRINLLQIIKLRDKATHLLIEEIRHSISQLFQSSIINYINEYKNNFGQIPLAEDMTGMLSLIIPGENNIKEIKKIYGEKTDNEINNFLQELKNLKKEYDSDNFMTNINYSAYISKTEKKSNITIKNGIDGENAIILEKIRDPKDKYKYTYSQIIDIISNKYNKFNQRTMRLFFKKHNIYNNKEYSYEYFKKRTYSETLVNFIFFEIQNDKNFFETIKK